MRRKQIDCVGHVYRGPSLYRKPSQIRSLVNIREVAVQSLLVQMYFAVPSHRHHHHHNAYSGGGRREREKKRKE